jgi:multiple sugar transport system permease protein
MAMTSGVSAAVVDRARRRRRAKRRHYATVAAFMSPFIVGFLVFTIYPMLASLYFSFTRYNLLSPPQWAGLSNYRFMLTSDPNFWLSLRNTIWFIVVSVPLQVVFGIGAAMVLTRVKRGAGIYRTIFFLPTMVPLVAAALGFLFVLNPSGPINSLLRLLHLPQPLWFENPTYAKPALVMIALWGVGNTMILFLASLLDVPAPLYEAAHIEGAGPWQRFRHITLPMITPVIFFSVVTGVIYGFQYFTEAYVVSNNLGGASSAGVSQLGYPQGSLLFYSVWLYQQGFESFHMGYASALAWVLFIIILVFTLLFLRSSRRWVHYQGAPS